MRRIPEISHSIWILLVLTTAMMADARVKAAEDVPGGETETREIAETARLTKAELPHWAIWQGAERQQELKLQPNSTLKWTNPYSGRCYGDLYFWTLDGRPEVVMSVFKAWVPADGFHVELQSLSQRSLVAERDGKVAWTPDRPGVSWQAVPAAAAPAATATARLSQMRRIASEFQVTLSDQRRNQNGERLSLRMLTQPLFRYQGTSSEWIDGAVFGFVVGTDPEALLLLEAQHDQETATWNFGLVRMNNDAMSATYAEQPIWKVDRQGSDDWIHQPYLLTRVAETPQE